MERNPLRVCLIHFEDQGIVDILESTFNCTVLRSEDGAELVDDKDVVFLFKDFNSNVFTNLANSYPFAHILGCAVVMNRYRLGKPFPMSRPKRPLYNESLMDINVVVGHGEESARRSWTKLIRYMGGHVRKEPDSSTIVLLTTQARGKSYRQFVSLGQHVFLPSWVEECWSNRDDLDFSPFSSEMITRHRIRVFQGLQIFIDGFPVDETDDMKKHITENGGFILATPLKATHCVLGPAAAGCNYEFTHNQRLVTNEWVWTSISIQYCANEDLYSVDICKAQIVSSSSPRTRASISINERSVSDEVLSWDPQPVIERKLSRSQQVLLELYETDVSYISALKLLDRVKQELENEIARGAQLLPKSEITLIFGKVPPIISVHERMVAEIKPFVYSGQSANAVQVLINSFDDLNRVYAPYSNTYDIAGDTLAKADKMNARLHAFIRARECSIDFKRNTLQDLLIRPVQRLPTLIVLLKELQKHDKKSKTIEEAIVLIDKVVRLVLSFFNEVEGVPPHLMCSRRRILKSVEALSLCGTHRWHYLDSRRVKIVLFNDMIMVCKIRNIDSQGTLRRLKKHTSFSSLADSKKRLKYFAHFLIPCVREVNRIKLSDYDGQVDDRLEPAGVSPIHCWTVRDVSGDATWVVECENRDDMIDFVDEVFMDIGRDVTWCGLEIGDIPYANARDFLNKHVMKLELSRNVPSVVGTLGRRSARGLRRTISQVTTRLTLPFTLRTLRTTQQFSTASLSRLNCSVAATNASGLASHTEPCYCDEHLDEKSVLGLIEESDVDDASTGAALSDKEN
ncbi:hypothetical protein Q1695_000009 [Nippostrongylus brasiliensis]|nr:hypothetical protein Q1695_000009 [Nippostrongylus brasiliensis]